jgi:hypothetical protein
MKGENMNVAKFAVVLLLPGLFASGSQAQINHVEMRVEGMT